MSNITCIITVCDRNNYINDAITSVINQTKKPKEIIIIDNGFKKTNISQKFSNLIKIYNILPYAGIAQALNFGVSLSNSDYIAFLEDDDLWPEDYLEIISSHLNNNDMIISKINKLQNNIISKYKNALNKLNVQNLLVSNPGINISNLTIKKNSFYKIGGFDTDLLISVDKSLALKFLLNNFFLKVCTETSTIKRFHKKNYTFNKKLYLKNLKIFYRKYKNLMNLKTKFAFYKKYIYYSFKKII